MYISNITHVNITNYSCPPQAAPSAAGWTGWHQMVKCMKEIGMIPVSIVHETQRKHGYRYHKQIFTDSCGCSRGTI